LTTITVVSYTAGAKELGATITLRRRKKRRISRRRDNEKGGEERKEIIQKTS
jgi:hypothetical protein